MAYVVMAYSLLFVWGGEVMVPVLLNLPVRVECNEVSTRYFWKFFVLIKRVWPKMRRYFNIIPESVSHLSNVFSLFHKF